jgi:hypothetical protein
MLRQWKLWNHSKKKLFASLKDADYHKCKNTGIQISDSEFQIVLTDQETPKLFLKRTKFSLDSNKSRVNIEETNKVWSRIMKKSNVTIYLQKLTRSEMILKSRYIN